MIALRRAVHAELLRALSGTSFVAMAGFGAVIAAYLLFSSDVEAVVRSAVDPTRAVFAYVAAAPAGAVLLGSYAVTREYYYHSTERTILLVGARTAFAAKLVAGAASGVLVAVVACVLWLGVTLGVLGAYGAAFVPSADLVATSIGTLASCTFVGAFAAAMGWLLRNYYLTVGVTLMLPALLGPYLLNHGIAVERFLPVGSAAATGGAPIDGLLPPGLGAVVLLGWALVAIAVAAVVVRRRGIV